MTEIGIIVGSTRQNRLSPQVAAWVKEIADARGTETYHLVDIKEYNLPLHDEPVPAAMSGDYQAPEAHIWSERINSLDGFVFITPEYNRGIPTPLKNAIDYLGREFSDKAAGIVTYGSSNGQIAAAALRTTLSTLGVATVQSQPGLNIFTDFHEMTDFAPGSQHVEPVKALLDQVAAWSGALKTIR